MQVEKETGVRSRGVIWNVARIVGAKRTLKEKQVSGRSASTYRAGSAYVTGYCSTSRSIASCGAATLCSCVGDVTSGNHIRARSTVVQQENDRPVQFEISETARDSLTAWLQQRGGTLDDYLFPSRLGRCPHIGTRQYARLVDEWVNVIGLRPEEYGTHSLRRTKASLIHKRTGNLRAMQILLGHTKIESIVRYLGVDIEDALTISEATEI